MPSYMLRNINSLRQNIVADCAFQLRVILKHSQTVSDAVFDSGCPCRTTYGSF